MQPQACGRTLTQVALSERDAHPGFQIALEGDCPPLVGEFDDDVDLHWARLLACGTPYALTFGIPSAVCDGLRLSP